MHRGLLTLFALTSLACARSHANDNAKAKARIFQRAEDEPPAPPPPAIDVNALGGSPRCRTACSP